MLRSLPDSIKQYFEVIGRADLEKTGAVPAAVLAITGVKGTAFGSRQDGRLIDVLPGVKGNHGFYPDHKEIRTGFVACGAGLQKGVLISQMNLVDICPLIVHLAGISFGPMEGKLYPEMFAITSYNR